MRLIPKDSEYTWALYSVLYFGFFFIDPIESHASPLLWCITLLATAVFLLLYFSLFWVSCRQGLLHLAAMVLMGIGFAKYNGGATTFFIFAAACGPFIVDTEVDGVKILLAVEVAAGLTWWALHLNGWFLVFGNGLAFVVGLATSISRSEIGPIRSCFAPRKKLNTSPKSPSANASPATCTTSSGTRSP